MKLHNPKLVGALLDGELKGLQRLLMQRHVNRCAVCAAEHRLQRHVRAMLTANPPGIPPMSDSPDFFRFRGWVSWIGWIAVVMR